MGIEPTTFTIPIWCSTTWGITPELWRLLVQFPPKSWDFFFQHKSQDLFTSVIGLKMYSCTSCICNLPIVLGPLVKWLIVQLLYCLQVHLFIMIFLCHGTVCICTLHSFPSPSSCIPKYTPLLCHLLIFCLPPLLFLPLNCTKSSYESCHMCTYRGHVQAAS